MDNNVAAVNLVTPNVEGYFCISANETRGVVRYTEWHAADKILNGAHIWLILVLLKLHSRCVALWKLLNGAACVI